MPNKQKGRKMRKISIVLGCTSILSIALLICTAFNIEPAYAEKGEFQYHQKPVKKIKEKTLKYESLSLDLKIQLI